MRKWGKFLVLLGVLMAVLTVGALAAGPGELQPDTVGGKTYTIHYQTTEGAQNSGKQYVLLILRGEGATPDNVNADSILYIDQVAADANGVVNFVGFQLKSRTTAQVFISGESLDAPINPYVIRVAGVDLSGTVAYLGSTPATVTIFNSKKEEISSTVTGTDGSFAVSGIPAGAVYTVTASKTGHLSHTKTVNVADEELVLDRFQLSGGDVNSNGQINAIDLSALLADFGRSTINAVEKNSDVNENGSINAIDLSELLGNFGKRARVDS